MSIEINGVDFYTGAASGQQRAAMTRLEPSHVMISHATQNNKPFPGDYELFVDCGGYHHMMTGRPEYATTNAEYLDYVAEHEPELWALRDYPCEPNLLESVGRSVADHQEMTLDRHVELLDMAEDRGMPGQPVSVVQGWTTQQYERHLDALRDHGALTDYVALGTVCRRHQDRDIADVVLRARDLLDGQQLHAFGVKGSVLRFREVVDALDSVDSAAYDYATSSGVGDRAVDEAFTWRDCARDWLNWMHDLSRRVGTESLDDPSTTQTELPTACQ